MVCGFVVLTGIFWGKRETRHFVDPPCETKKHGQGKRPFESIDLFFFRRRDLSKKIANGHRGVLDNIRGRRKLLTKGSRPSNGSPLHKIVLRRRGHDGRRPSKIRPFFDEIPPMRRVSTAE
jgi:hypothetical protein